MARNTIALVVNRSVEKMTEWGRHQVNICTVFAKLNVCKFPMNCFSSKQWHREDDRNR